MAKPLLRDFRVHTAREQRGGVAVPQIVESDLWEILHLVHVPAELIGERERRMNLAVSPTAHQGRGRLPDTEPEQVLCLIPFQPAQLGDPEGGEGDRARLPVLRWLETQRGLGLFDGLYHLQGATIEIDVFPSQGEDLAPTHAGG